MKRLLLLASLMALLVVASATADVPYSGSATALKPLSFAVSSTGGTFTVVASFAVNSGGGWQGQGYTLTVSDASGSVCRADSIGSSPLSCTVADSAAGTYRVAFWPTKGKSVYVSVAVTGAAS